jgi:hypothetical protein
MHLGQQGFVPHLDMRTGAQEGDKAGFCDMRRIGLAQYVRDECEIVEPLDCRSVRLNCGKDCWNRRSTFGCWVDLVSLKQRDVEETIWRHFV